MKTPLHPRSLALTLLLGSLALSGCSSLNNVSVSDPAENTQVQGVSAQGKVLGGHAPVVGSHVYLLQSSASGIGTQATSLLEPATVGAVMNGTTDPSLPSTWYYVTTDSTGAFNFSTSANCASGLALYLYAYGGTSQATTNTTALNNPAIVNLATLGSCGTITSLPYIYLNEVSTVATAYAFQGFTKPATSTTVNNNATFIGSSNSVQGEKGITNAAATAGELYSIDGHFVTTEADGEGHIANPLTLNGNGIVPQATIDTLANILANCVDTNNTSTTHNAACYQLFSLATNTGTACSDAATPVCPTGTYAPIDTATAAINIARHPAGLASANFMTTIYGFQGTTVPYTPHLTTKPNDFTIAIQYPVSSATYSQVANNYLNRAESVEVDGNGYLWITSQGTSGANAAAFQWDSQGVLQSNVNQPGYIYGYVSIDGNNNAWAGNADSSTGIEEFNSNGQATATYGAGEFNTAYTVITDKAGDVYFGAGSNPTPVNTGANQDLFALTTADQANGTSTQPQHYSISSSGFNGGIVSHGAIDTSGNLWITGESTENITNVTKTGTLGAEGGNGCFFGTTSCFPIDTPTVTANSLGLPRGTAVVQPQPEFPAINSLGYAIIPIQTIYSGSTGSTAQSVPGVFVVDTNGGYISELYSGTCTGGGCATQTNNFGQVIHPVYTGANFYQSFGAAIDGDNNIWIANRLNASLGGTATAGNGNSTLIELNGTNYSAISPATNYIPSSGVGATPIMSDALNLAIDPSGNIWITNYTGNQMVEMVGAAAPVVTPLSVAAGNNDFGVTP